MVVGQALKGAIYASKMMEQMGFERHPRYDEKRGDIVTAVIMGERNL